MRFGVLLVFAAFLCLAVSAFAQGINPDSKEPMEITADESLEWHRVEKYFVARRNVRAVQGQTTLRAALLTAQYREERGGGMKIHTVVAEGNVEIISAQSKAYGDRATYDIDKGYAVMTGRDLRIIAPDQTVTAKDKMEYWSAQGRLKAVGRAKAVREGDEIVADVLTADFVTDANGKRVLKTLTASGNVVITTPTEVLTGDEGVYQADNDTAELTGNVKVTRWPNVLEGERAEVNLKTNISKMFGGSAAGGGRVRGVFYPGSVEKPPAQ